MSGFDNFGPGARVQKSSNQAMLGSKELQGFWVRYWYSRIPRSEIAAKVFRPHHAEPVLYAIKRA